MPDVRVDGRDTGCWSEKFTPAVVSRCEVGGVRAVGGLIVLAAVMGTEAEFAARETGAATVADIRTLLQAGVVEVAVERVAPAVVAFGATGPCWSVVVCSVVDAVMGTEAEFAVRETGAATVADIRTLLQAGVVEVAVERVAPAVVAFGATGPCWSVVVCSVVDASCTLAVTTVAFVVTTVVGKPLPTAIAGFARGADWIGLENGAVPYTGPDFEPETTSEVVFKVPTLVLETTVLGLLTFATEDGREEDSWVVEDTSTGAVLAVDFAAVVLSVDFTAVVDSVDVEIDWALTGVGREGFGSATIWEK